MKLIKPIAIVTLFLVLITALYVWFFIWNKPQTNIKNATAIKTEARELFTQYTANEKTANANYIDKILEVTGTAGTVSKNAEGLDVVFLLSGDPMFGVICTMEEQNTGIKTGDVVTLKGICTGFLTDVVLIRCYKIK
jgi:hypothetical protein